MIRWMRRYSCTRKAGKDLKIFCFESGDKFLGANREKKVGKGLSERFFFWHILLHGKLLTIM